MNRWERIITRAVASAKARARAKLKKRYRRERVKSKVQKRVEKREQPKAWRVHIKARYDQSKHHEIDYEASIVVMAENEDEAMEKAVDHLVDALGSKGYPIVWNRIEVGVEGADPNDVGEEEILCRGRPI